MSEIVRHVPNFETRPDTAVARIMVLEAQRSYVDALRLVLDITEDLHVVSVETEFSSIRERVKDLRLGLVITSNRPDVGLTGLDVVEALRDRGDGVARQDPAVPVVVLSSFPTPVLAQTARTFSNVSVVAKERPITDVVRSLRSAFRGQPVFVGIHDDPFHFTSAEVEVLEALVMGHTASSIADELHLSVHAIRARIRGVLTKTSSTSQLEAVSKAIRAGVIAPPPVVGY